MSYFASTFSKRFKKATVAAITALLIVNTAAPVLTYAAEDAAVDPTPVVEQVDTQIESLSESVQAEEVVTHEVTTSTEETVSDNSSTEDKGQTEMSNTSVETAAVNNPPFFTDISGPTSVVAGQAASWTLSATDPENEAMSFIAVWDDGSETAPQTDATFTKTYSTPGNYTAVFTVRDSIGQTAQASYQIVVTQAQTTTQAPTITGFTGDSTLAPGQTGTWTVTATDPENGQLSYELSYGQTVLGTQTGKPSGQSVAFSHAFASAGTYTLSIKVTDAQGLVTNGSYPVTVTNGNTAEHWVKVTAPNGDQRIVRGTRYNIEWRGTDVFTDYEIELLKNGAKVADVVDADDIANANPNNPGESFISHIWSVPAGTEVGNDYAIRVKAKSAADLNHDNALNDWLVDESDDTFSILADYSLFCFDITEEMSNNARSSDNEKSGQVSLLQHFLIAYARANGLPNTLDNQAVGYFGNVTETALKEFQAKVGLPQTGITDAATRAKINEIGCGTTNPGNQPPYITAINGPTSLTPGQTGSWTVVATDPEGRQLEYSMQFGDGASAATTTNNVFTHAFASTGTYTLRAVVADDIDQTAQATLTVVVTTGGNGGDHWVKVTAPNGGQRIVRGTQYNIEWRSTDVIVDAKLELLKGGVKVADIADVTDATANSTLIDYLWLVPANTTVGDDYKVRIIATTARNTTLTDESDNNFSILADYGLFCLNLTETLADDGHSSDNEKNGQVSLLQHFLIAYARANGLPNTLNNQAVGYFGPVTTQALKEFQAKVGLPQTGITDAATRAKIAQISCGNQPGQELVVTRPNGGETWVRNTTEAITWTDTVSNQEYGIYLVNVQTNDNIGLIATTTGAVRSYNWTVARLESGQTVDNGQYKVRICRGTVANNNLVCDASNNPFTITNGGGGGNQAPIIDSFNGPSDLKVDDSGNWEVVARDPEGGVLDYVITWGDSRSDSRNDVTSGSTQGFSHAYGSTGTYTVTVTVTDPNGLSDTETRTVRIDNRSNGGGGGGGGGSRRRGPTAPIIIASSHQIDVPNPLEVVSVAWTASRDRSGRGLAGYSYEWSTSRTTEPDDSVDTEKLFSFTALADGTYYFHIKALDNAGRESDTTHFGPIIIRDGGTGNLPEACRENYLKKYIKLGAANDPAEVRKLQVFLKEVEGYDVPVTGFYDDVTYQAVKHFQAKYGRDVLRPWGIIDSTGYVYITTSLVINRLHCGYTTAHNLDLRNYYPAGYQNPNPAVPADDESDEEIATSTDDFVIDDAATSTDEEIATSTDGFLQGAAVGVLDFLKGAWWWILLLILLALLIWNILRDKDDEKEEGKK